MKPPCYQVTAICRNAQCLTGEYRKEVKEMWTVGTDGIVRTKTKVVCPECRNWGEIYEYRLVPLSLATTERSTA